MFKNDKNTEDKESITKIEIMKEKKILKINIKKTKKKT